MPRLLSELELARCPHCGVDKPSLRNVALVQTADYAGINPRHWAFYGCSRCGGVVSAWSSHPNGEVMGLFPEPDSVPAELPERARAYLAQAMATVHAPAGAVMLAASAVDAMLKAKGLSQGGLFSRIEQAAREHLITDDMKEWAHDVRLDANDQRHSDESAALPAEADAKRVVDFALAFATFLFVLPARVQRGRQAAQVRP
jgi:hypothetical protein